VVGALLGGEARTVRITTGMYGAGGFGKTSPARMVRADRRGATAVRAAMSCRLDLSGIAVLGA
jgi:hypothetical protein